jgi:hypothetical protein
LRFTAASPAPQGRSWFGTAAKGSITDLVLIGESSHTVASSNVPSLGLARDRLDKSGVT